jgi:hypothetical protein
MPRATKTEAPIVADAPILTARQVDFDGFSVQFAEYHVDADGTSVFRGLPDDRCQCPHWGVVVSGEIRFRYADGEEVYRNGDAFYAPAGHVPLVTAGSEVIEFSPTAELQLTMQHLTAAMTAMADQS